MTDAKATDTATGEPANRIRVQLTFELSIHEPGFPGWLVHIVESGINDLIDDGHAKSPVILHEGVHYQVSRVTEQTIKRRTRRKRTESP